jgi:hypothetical protein
VRFRALDRHRESPIYLSDWISWFTLLDTDLHRVEAVVQVEGAWLRFAHLFIRMGDRVVCSASPELFFPSRRSRVDRETD